MQKKAHWERVYATKAPQEVSWFQEHSELSLDLIRRAGVAPQGFVIDVGGGASTLVDDLLLDGFANVTVLDISAAALRGSGATWPTGGKRDMAGSRHHQGHASRPPL